MVAPPMAARGAKHTSTNASKIPIEGRTMSKEHLKQFLKKAAPQLKLPTAAAIADFTIRLANNPETNTEMRALLDETIFIEQPERKAVVFEERKMIEAADTYQQIIALMRRKTDNMNQHIIVQKAMEYEDEIIPELVRMLRTSINTTFIETAIRVLAKSTKDIAGELIERFNEIRNPYVQSMLLVVLGYKVDETYVDWFIEWYEKLEHLYPDKDYHEGAYYGLCEIENRLTAFDPKRY